MSRSSKAFEIGAHEGSPPADPEYDNDVVFILMLVKTIMMKMII